MRDKLIELARECGALLRTNAEEMGDGYVRVHPVVEFSTEARLRTFAARIRAEVMEEAAKICEARLPAIEAALKQIDADELMAKCCAVGRKQQAVADADAIRRAVVVEGALK